MGAFLAELLAKFAEALLVNALIKLFYNPPWIGASIYNRGWWKGGLTAFVVETTGILVGVYVFYWWDRRRKSQAQYPQPTMGGPQ